MQKQNAKTSRPDRTAVYAYLREIPRGKVVTYGQIARALGHPRLARWVGRVLHENPDGDQTPCYKVVNSRGKLSSSYAFGGMEAQKSRLETEGIAVKGETVDLFRYQYRGEPLGSE